MKTLKIDDTIYNLAYLISVKYKHKIREAAPTGKPGTAKAKGTLKSASSLDLHFLDCDTIHLKKDKADAVWSKLSLLLEIEADEAPPDAEIPTPS